MFALLEMWIRKAKKYFGKLCFLEEVGEKFHGVGANA
jgi:hypothetical protein